MGAIPDENGTTFRVWAPNASDVEVVGDFSAWEEGRHSLDATGDGVWEGWIEGAQPGDEYKLIVHADAPLYRLDPYARQVTSSVGNAVIHRTDDYDWLVPDDYRSPPWHEMVIYEMHLGTFTDPPGDGPGDFTSAIARLEHLARLGVNAIELMPPMEFPGERSWGYNPAHPFAIESDYGGPDAFKDFVRAAHERGMAVIIDVVYNHFGPSDLDMWRFDGWYENEGGGIYFYNDWRASTPWGDTRPDYGRPEVRRYLTDNALMWIEDYRIDGLRWDATAYVRNVWGGSDPGAELADGWAVVREVNDAINQRQPWKVSIAEDLRGHPAITEPTDAGGAGFDAQWDDQFVFPVRAALIEADDARRDMWAVARALDHRYGADAFRRIIYTESHDEVANGKARVPEEIWPGNADGWHSVKRSILGAVLVFTAPGVPMIFQGQELLEDQWFRDDDPIDWSRLETHAGIVQLFADLIALRRNRAGATAGLTGQHLRVHHINDADKVLAYHRWADDESGDVVVVANFADRRYDRYTIGVPQTGGWRVIFDSDAPQYHEHFTGSGATELSADEQSREGMPASLDVGLGPYSAVILVPN